jgi:urease accessory protein
MSIAMPDAPTDPACLQRAKGRAAVALVAGPRGRAVLADLHQQGSAKAVLPRIDGGTTEVVFLNTSGGLTGGDRLDYALTLAPAIRATATTQTAERAYRSARGTARAEVRLTVGAGGWLDWLPQETILFDGASLDRDIRLDLGPGAGCLFLETVILGRHAMGETVTGLHFRDNRLICREGQPLWAEPLHIDTRVLERAGNPAMLGGARAMATLALVHPQATDRLAPLRAVLDEPGVESGASALDGRLILRMLAWDGLPLRRQTLRALAVLRPGPVPRVWQT